MKRTKIAKNRKPVAAMAHEACERLHLLIHRLLEQVEHVEDAVRAAQKAGLIGYEEGRWCIVALDQMWHEQPCIRLTPRGN